MRALALLNAANAQGQKPDNAAALADLSPPRPPTVTLPEPFSQFRRPAGRAFRRCASASAGQVGMIVGKALIASLQPLTADAKNPWAGEARLESALIAAHGLHDYKQARALLAPLLTATAI